MERNVNTESVLDRLKSGTRSLKRATGPLHRQVGRLARDGVGETVSVSRRFLTWQARKQLYLPLLRRLSSEDLVRQTVNGQELYLDLNDPGLSERLLVRGEHEPAIADRWTTNLSEGMTVLDIGGNLGYYTLLAANEVTEEGRVHSIEPHPENYGILCKNVEQNGFDQVSTWNKAIADSTGTKSMFLTDESNWGTLFDWEDAQASEYMTEKMAEATTDVLSVETTTLDRFASVHDIDDVDAIRMDLEGFEISVLEGMHELLASADSPCWIFIEVHNKLIENYEEVVKNLVLTYGEYGFEPTELIIGNEPVEFDSGSFLETLISYDNCCPHLILKK